MGRMTKFIVIVLITYSFSSCIFEDRSGCPAYFEADFIDVTSSVNKIYLVYQFESGLTFIDTVLRPSFDTYGRTVPRGRFYLAAFGNVRNMQYRQGFSVPEGMEADSLYTAFRELCSDDDLLYDQISLEKDFIRLSVRVMGYGLGYDSVYVAIRSNAVGYDLKGDVMPGEYMHKPFAVHEPDSADSFYEFSSRIIRQPEDDIVIDLYVSLKGESELLGSINVSELAAGGGFLVDNSQDLFVVIDFSSSTVTLSPEGWNHTHFVEIEI